MAVPAVFDFSFQDKPIRCFGTIGQPWFVAKDVCEALGIPWRGNTLDQIKAAWRGMRSFRIPQINQHGQQGFTEIEMVCINEAAVYKLAFRSRSEHAEAFTDWVAEEVLPSIRKTGRYVNRRREKYQLAGKTEEWIDTREEAIETRKDLTGVLKEHGVDGGGYPQCTNAIYRPLLGGTAGDVKRRRRLKRTANLRDELSARELLRVRFAEDLAREKIEREALAGNDECVLACRLAGDQVANAIDTTHRTAVGDPTAG